MRKCNKCRWVFKKHHTTDCPRCDCSSQFIKTNEDELKEQAHWKHLQAERFHERIEEAATNDVCCFRSTHTNGWHHEDNCKNHVIPY